ncbi:MAG: dephospho-CoA kinase [Clostridiales bacterium]|nr:dephospho-CoA kinase [Clostridiales bacterium]
MIIGITGGVGSGKTFISNILKEEFGGILLNADKIGHRVIEMGYPAYDLIVKEFGEGILNKDKGINRKILGQLVFTDEDKLKKLNQIIHPAVKEFIKKEIKQIKDLYENPLIVVEAALLIEDNYHEICDQLWFVYTDEKTRRKRLKDNRGYSDKQIDNIMKNQLSVEEYIEKTQVSIHNNSLEETLNDIKRALVF